MPPPNLSAQAPARVWGTALGPKTHCQSLQIAVDIGLGVAATPSPNLISVKRCLLSNGAPSAARFSSLRCC
eukprot:4807989-Pyramimonas_sp.AAC.1